jgi:hypothetical protein
MRRLRDPEGSCLWQTSPTSDGKRSSPRASVHFYGFLGMEPPFPISQQIITFFSIHFTRTYNTNIGT